MFLNIQALKYRSFTDVVRPIREIVRRSEETTGETEVYCLSDPSVLVSERMVTLSNVNQNVAGGERNGEVENELKCYWHAS